MNVAWLSKFFHVACNSIYRTINVTGRVKLGNLYCYFSLNYVLLVKISAEFSFAHDK